MALSTIDQLKPGMKDKVIEVKVYRAWTARDPPSIIEKGFRAILLDRQGDAIQANAEANDIDHFKPILIPGQAYRVSDFECVQTDNWQQTLENQTSLSFSKTTKFDQILSENFPLHYFNFVSYNQLPSFFQTTLGAISAREKSRKLEILSKTNRSYEESASKISIGTLWN